MVCLTWSGCRGQEDRRRPSEKEREQKRKVLKERNVILVKMKMVKQAMMVGRLELGGFGRVRQSGHTANSKDI